MGSQTQASRASRPLRGLHCGPQLERSPDLHTPTPEARFHPSLSMEPWGNVARLHTAEARFQLIGRLQMRQSYSHRALGLRLCSLMRGTLERHALPVPVHVTPKLSSLSSCPDTQPLKTERTPEAKFTQEASPGERAKAASGPAVGGFRALGWKVQGAGLWGFVFSGFTSL